MCSPGKEKAFDRVSQWACLYPRVKFKIPQLEKPRRPQSTKSATQMRYFVYWCSPEYQARWTRIELNMETMQEDAFKNWRGLKGCKLEGDSTFNFAFSNISA